MVVDFLPGDAALGVYGEAAVDEVPRLVRNIDSRVVWPRGFYLFEDVHIADAGVWILPVEKLVEYHSK